MHPFDVPGSYEFTGVSHLQHGIDTGVNILGRDTFKIGTWRVSRLPERAARSEIEAVVGPGPRDVTSHHFTRQYIECLFEIRTILCHVLFEIWFYDGRNVTVS